MISFWITVVPPKIYANLFSRVGFEDATRGPGSQLLGSSRPFRHPSGSILLHGPNRDGIAHFVSRELAVAGLLDLPIIPIEPHPAKRSEVVRRSAT